MGLSFVTWIILGLVGGFVGSKIVNKSGQGFLLDIALGIIGAIVGGYIFHAVGARGADGLDLWSFFVAIIGSVVVLFAYHAITGKSRL